MADLPPRTFHGDRHLRGGPIAVRATAFGTRPAAGETASQRVHRLGEARDRAALPALLEALGHRSSNVRRLAASALGKIGDPAAVVPLLRHLQQEPHAQAKQYAVKALGLLGDPQAIDALAAGADAAEAPYTRDAARTSLRALRRQQRSPAGGH